jgi:predicted deacylase
VIAGIHGDEPSGVRAARALAARGPALRGRLLVLPEANPEALAAESREAPGAGDLNRAFPGRRLGGLAGGRDAERRAFALFRLVRTARPDLVLDLHESDGTWAEGLGPFLVVPALPRAAELALAMLELPGMEEFSYTGGPPGGSLAAETVRLLGIPALIVEIPDSVPPSRRAELHRAAVEAAMAVLGMMDTGEEGRIKPCR